MSVHEPGQNYHDNGRFTRPSSAFRSFISRDPNSKYPAEKGRYALYLSPSCPWAHRTLIVRHLKGLEDMVDVYPFDNHMGPDGWVFSGRSGSLAADPLHGFTMCKELYLKADAGYVGRFTVPFLWDKKTSTIVNNESSEIMRMLTSEFDHLLPAHLREANQPGGGLYPESLRDELDRLNEWVYAVNNGVYRVGLAATQAAYDEGIVALFAALDRLEEVLAHGGRYLLGDTLTEADVRLFPTLVRFDVAYHSIFGCDRKTVRHDYPRLHLWLRRLYWSLEGEGELRGAFYRSTQPYMAGYRTNYAAARRRVLFGDEGVLIVPSGPDVLIEPLTVED